VDYYSPRKTETALHWAVRMSKVDVVKVLMEHAADPFITSSSGPTPMELAIQESHQTVISLMTGAYPIFIFIYFHFPLIQFPFFLSI
jgi:ankyrin repeat protein